MSTSMPLIVLMLLPLILRYVSWRRGEVERGRDASELLASESQRKCGKWLRGGEWFRKLLSKVSSSSLLQNSKPFNGIIIIIS